MTEDTTSPLMFPPDSGVATKLRQLAQTQRMVFFAGLPGVGKSLLIRELVHTAHDLGRHMHLLQWDVARQSFLSSSVLAKYPDAAGVTHAVIRKAMGAWSRNAVVAWHESNPDATDLLIGETPLIGNRFIELAVPMNDDTEPLLRAAHTSFLIPVPTKEVRSAIEAARAQSTANPRHERERGDARPNVMHAMWEELRQTASQLGLNSPADESYSPDTYRGVYLEVLKHRRPEVLPVDIVLPPGSRSVYDVQVPFQDVDPTHAEREAFIEQVERTYADLADLEEEVAQWYAV